MEFPAFTKTEAALIEACARKINADPYAVASVVYSGICLGSIDRISSTSIIGAYRSATRNYTKGTV